MQPGKEARFCNTCQTPVIDFSGKTLDEIQSFFANQHAAASVCGRYSIHHTNQSSKGMRALRWFEMQMKHPFLKKAALVCISCLRVLSGCVRRVQGKLRAYDDAPS